ncbi:Telomerase ribonucleoprotein complex - RNA binding domain protein [Cryptosporidium meleagridis]|uniref:Telomerase reverse transcriptase n=1 Tax=Cryptosporidium meleagridis TaxID=93969 RepID=A0A2P4YZA5_9CRYT|nr:Telomerase ribonucleoprotein complex - RNA binding domain protein [Cryptosporidium meleagridis]
MSVLKGALAVLMKQEVMTLGEYLEQKRKITGCKEEGLYNDSLGELRRLLEETLILEDPLIPKALKEGFLGLRELTFDSSDNSLDINGDRKKLLGINIEKLLEWSSILSQNYFSSPRNHSMSSGKRSRNTEYNETLPPSFITDQIKNTIPDSEKDSLTYQVKDFELLLRKHFPKIRIFHSGSYSALRTSFDTSKPKKYSYCNSTSYKFHNIHAWNTLLSKIGPIEILFLFVCCIIFRLLGDHSEILIQQAGRMLTNDFLEELARLYETGPKKTNSCVSSSSLTPILTIKEEKEEVKPLNETPRQVNKRSGEIFKDSRLSRIYNVDIPYRSTILYCDHFSKRGGLPCLSVLRLLPPNLLGARTLLRFVTQNDHIFKDYNRQSLIRLLGSYEMTKFSRVKCKLASFMMGEFQNLLLNIRNTSPVDFLGQICPIEPIKDSDLQNFNKLPIPCFETSSTKVVNFLRLYLIKVLPKNILGTFKNFKTFINKKIPIIVNLHIRETFKIQHAMNGIEVSNWVNRILEEKSYQFIKESKNLLTSNQRSKKVTSKMTRSSIKKSLISLGKTYLARNMYFLIVYLVFPILRRHFYATEIEGSNKVRYFRHPVWIKIVRQADKWYLENILKGIQSKDYVMNLSSIQEISKLIDQNSDFSENIPKIRWLPKSKGLRPLINLSKVGSGQILRQNLERDHTCEEKNKIGFCDCNSVWTGGDLPTSWINNNYHYNNFNGNGNNGNMGNNNNIGGKNFASFSGQNDQIMTPPGRLGLSNYNLGIGINSGSSVPTTPINKVMRRPSSNRIIDIRRPSTNNMLFYPSKILRSFLLRMTGKNHLGASLVQFGDIYKIIKNWWIKNRRDKQEFEMNEDFYQNEGKKTSHVKIYIIKADLVNCFENINKSKIFEFLDVISLPDEIFLLSLYSRTLSKTTIIPPFDNMNRDSYQDELGRSCIITSKGKLNMVPIFEKDQKVVKSKIERIIGPDLDDLLWNLKNSCLSNKDLSILGQKKAEIFTFLNSRRVINWKLVKEIIKIHLNTSFFRLRTCSKSLRLMKSRQIGNSVKFGKKFLSLFKQDFGIPQGSSISYILCCLYYNFLDLNPEIQNLLGQSFFSSSYISLSFLNAIKQEKVQVPDTGKKDLFTKRDLETRLSRYPEFKENEINIYNTSTSKKRRLEKSEYNINAKSVLLQPSEEFNNNVNNQNCQIRVDLKSYDQESLLLRWVDDFLFLTSDLESAKKFLKLLYIQKLWGSNVSRDKINSNFPWIDHNNEIIIFEEDGILPSSSSSSSSSSFPLSTESPNSFVEKKINTTKSEKDCQNEKETIKKARIALKQFHKQVSWTGMKFSSDNNYLNCMISPWKNLEFICVMDTVTLTTKHQFTSNYSNFHSFKPMKISENLQKSNYMWSVLGIKLIRYFDFRIKNGLLYDCRISSLFTIYTNIVIVVYIGILKLLSTFKRIKKIHQGFINPKFLVKVLEWISNACCYNIYSYKKQLPNKYQWNLLIKCAVYDSIITCLNSRYKALGIDDFFKSYRIKYQQYSSILNKKFNIYPRSSFSIIKEHLLDLPKLYRIKKKG